MDRSYSMQLPQQPPAGDSFKFVSEAKREVWRVDGGDPAEPSCCLSVSNISYTVR